MNRLFYFTITFCAILLFGVKAYDEFGMTEFLGPGMTCECQAGTENTPQRMHAWADHLLAECINPETGQPVADGQAAVVDPVGATEVIGVV